MSLLPHHREQLKQSAISEEQISERGYFSVDTKARLAELGFGRSQ